MPDLVVVFETSSLAASEIVKGLLESNDIDVMVLSDDCGGMRPALSFSRGIRLCVDKESAAAARAIVAEFEEADGTD